MICLSSCRKKTKHTIEFTIIKTDIVNTQNHEIINPKIRYSTNGGAICDTTVYLTFEQGPYPQNERWTYTYEAYEGELIYLSCEANYSSAGLSMLVAIDGVVRETKWFSNPSYIPPSGFYFDNPPEVIQFILAGDE